MIIARVGSRIMPFGRMERVRPRESRIAEGIWLTLQVETDEVLNPGRRVSAEKGGSYVLGDNGWNQSGQAREPETLSLRYSTR